MDVPASVAGVVKEIKVNVGDSVSEGSLVLIVEVAGAAAPEAPVAAPAELKLLLAAPAAAATTALQEVLIPDIGGDEVEVTEVMVAVGDTIAEDQDMLTVEGDKASMDVPAPFAGVVKEIKVASGDKVSEGTLVFIVEVAGAAPAPVAALLHPLLKHQKQLLLHLKQLRHLHQRK